MSTPFNMAPKTAMDVLFVDLDCPVEYAISAIRGAFELQRHILICAVPWAMASGIFILAFFVLVVRVCAGLFVVKEKTSWIRRVLHWICEHFGRKGVLYGLCITYAMALTIYLFAALMAMATARALVYASTAFQDGPAASGVPVLDGMMLLAIQWGVAGMTLAILLLLFPWEILPEILRKKPSPPTSRKSRARRSTSRRPRSRRPRSRRPSSSRSRSRKSSSSRESTVPAAPISRPPSVRHTPAWVQGPGARFPPVQIGRGGPYSQPRGGMGRG